MTDLYNVFIEIENSKVKIGNMGGQSRKKQYLKIFPSINRSTILLKPEEKKYAFVRISLK